MIQRRATKRTAIRLLVVASVAIGAIAWVGWWKLFREVPQQLEYDTIEEQFKYGSIGTENAGGVPYWIWLVLPKMFPEYLPSPGGWATLGFGWEAGRELPVGFSKKTIGFERVGITCALCHSGRLHAPGEPMPRIVLGAPANAVDVLGYQRFLFACASDPRFTGSNVLQEIAQVTQLPFLDRVLYRFILVPQTRKALLSQKAAFAWTNTRPDWGRGRIDPFNPIKFGMLGLTSRGDDTIGNADMEPIWNLRAHAEHGMIFHWDGLNTDLTEVFDSSALGDGATPKSLPVAALRRLQAWASELQPPRFEALFPVDQDLVRAGAPIYRKHCARCHAIDGERTGRVFALRDEAWREGVEAGAPSPLYTDTHRAEMWTKPAAAAYDSYGRGYPWAFSHFQSTGGYVSPPLDGLWLRAPYLHNGSVPYLVDLLERPERRTKVFYRGLDVFDPKRMGFFSEGLEAERVGTRYDTAQAGNSNQGHLWGTDLRADEKTALLEYLKTL